MQLLILLPLAALVILFLLVWGSSFDPVRARLGDWRRAVLHAAVIWGAVLVVLGEILSLPRWLDRPGLALGWGAVAAIGAWLIWRRGSLCLIRDHLRHRDWELTRGDRALLAGGGAMVGALLLIGWMSPPNNIDSLLYHMSRVAHWAQNRSLAHYPAGMEHQLHKPIWAEEAILHLRVLWGTDRPAALVQWAAMVGSMIGVSWIAAQLGGGRKAQALGALLVLAIPMGILQSTSTQNDYVLAFWMVALASLVLDARAIRNKPSDSLYVGACAGLGFLTKGPAFVYTIPFLLWYFLPLKGRDVRQWSFDAARAGLLIVCLNLGFWSRNVITYGGPYGTSDWLRMNLFLDDLIYPAIGAGSERAPTIQPEGDSGGTPVGPKAARAEWAPSLSGSSSVKLLADQVPRGGILSQGWLSATDEYKTQEDIRFVTSLGGFLADLARKLLYMVALNLVTPFPEVNTLFFRAIEAMPGIINPAQLSDLRVLLWNHEDLAGSPFHLLLIGGLSIWAWAMKPAVRWRVLRKYTAAVLATFVLIPIVIGHGPTIWGIRYQLPFFVLGSAVPAVVLGEHLSRKAARIVGVGLLLLALPWVLLNRTRPLVNGPARYTYVDSVLLADRSEILLANYPKTVQNDYAEAAALARATDCTSVGLRLSQETTEYPFWWLLDAPQSGIRIESIFRSTAARRYVDPEFKPCVVICSTCGDEQAEPGYRLLGQSGRIFVFTVGE